MTFPDEKTLKVSGETHKQLKDMKWVLREETFDGVIKRLIQEYHNKKGK